MFRTTEGESESTSLYEVGVDGLKKSLHVVRGAAEVKPAAVGASRGAEGAGKRHLCFCVFPRDMD